MARTLAVVLVALVGLSLTIHGTPAYQGPAIPRVCSENPLLSAAIVQGAQRSTIFRRRNRRSRVRPGRQVRTGRTCVPSHVPRVVRQEPAPRILVNSRRAPGCELIASIGHELQHALEVLSNPNVRTSFGLSSFFHQIGPEGPRRFETADAIQAGLAVAREAC